MTLTTYNALGNPIPLPDRPLEPPPGWFGEDGPKPEPPEEDDGIDLDDGYVFQLRKGWTRMNEPCTTGKQPDLICVEGYKAFRGTMRYTPASPKFPPQEMTGDWLYMPDTDCWYGKGRSYPAKSCEIVQ